MIEDTFGDEKPEGLRIALIINKVRREAEVLKSIQLALEGNEREITARVFHKSKLEELVDFEPTLVMTFPFTSVGLSAECYVLKYLLGCHVVTYRREGAMIFGSRYDVEVFAGYDRYDSSLVDAELFWGCNMAEHIGTELYRQGKLKSLERVHVVGFPSLERFYNSNSPFQLPPLPEDIQSRLGRLDRSKTVLFVTGFHWGAYTREAILGAGDILDIRSSSASIELDYALRSTNNARITRHAWIEAIKQAAQDNPELNILVKIHPIEGEILDNQQVNPYVSLEGYENIWLLTEPLEIGSIIDHVSLLFHYGSTTSADACLQGVPSVYAYVEEALVNQTKYCQYTNTVFPSLMECEIKEVSSVLERHAASPIQYERTEEMTLELYRMFNLKEGETATPAADIAECLVSVAAKPPLVVESDNPFLTNNEAVQKKVARVGEHAFKKSKEAWDERRFTDSTKWEERAVALDELGGTVSLSFQLFRANKRAQQGRFDEAMVVLNKLIARIPPNERKLIKPGLGV